MITSDLIIPGTTRARSTYESLRELYFELKHKFDQINARYTEAFSRIRPQLRILDRVVADMEDCCMPSVNPNKKADEILDLLVASEFHYNYFKGPKSQLATGHSGHLRSKSI